MSAIWAGQECSACKDRYWISFGHPAWFGDKTSPLYQKFIEARSSGLCPFCWLENNVSDKTLTVLSPFESLVVKSFNINELLEKIKSQLKEE